MTRAQTDTRSLVPTEQDLLMSHRWLVVTLSLSAPLAAQDLAPFDAAVLMTGDQERFVKTADLDGDGRTEAIGWWRINATSQSDAIHLLSGYRNDGTGRLERVWTQEFTTASSYWNFAFDPHESCEVADLDGDGDDDFVISAGSRIDVWLSNGASAPTLAVSRVNELTDPWRGIALADFDQDGDLDLAAVRGSTLETYDFVLGAGVLVARSVRAGAWTLGRLLAVEATGDSTPDLVSDGRIVFPVVAGEIQAPSSYPALWNLDSAFELRHDFGDVDVDGDLDVVTFRKHVSLPDTSYRILRRTGASTFQMEGPFSGGPARRLFDIDGDGDLDGVCCGGGGGGVAYNRVPSSFRIALNDGAGQFAPALEVLGLGSTAIAGVADLDGDGRVDLVAGRCVYFQRRAMRESAQPVVGSRELLERVLLDVDGDGDLDAEPLPWSARRNRGDGRAELGPVPLPAPPAGSERTGQGYYGDWDGDGDLDLLVNLNTGGQISGMELLEHRGAWTFESRGVVVTDAGGFDFPFFADDGLAADVDGDGDLDLVKRGFTSAGVIRRSGWWRNDGASFERVATWESQLVLAVADYDGDAVADLLTTQETHSVGWMRGLGAGAFSPWQPLAIVDIGMNSNGVASADVDDDGDLDVVLADRLGGNNARRILRLLRNDGTGSFTPEMLSDRLAFSGASTVRVIDVDGDGRSDVVAAPAIEDAHAGVILRADPNGNGWNAPVVQMLLHPGTSGNGPAFPRFGVADFDGDGDMDLLTNRLIQGTRFHGEPRGLHVQIGTGTLGDGGLRPLLGGVGPFLVGEHARIVLRSARPGAHGVLTVAYTEGLPAESLGGGLVSSAQRARIVSQIPFTTSGVAGDPAGSGQWELPYVVPGYAAGRTKLYVAEIEDPSAVSGIARSNRVYVLYGL